MISTMSDPVFEKAVTIKTSKVPKLALDTVIARLKASDDIKWKGFSPTKEAVVNALWLWLGDMDPGRVEAAMAQYVPRLEAILKGDLDPGVSFDVGADFLLGPLNYDINSVGLPDAERPGEVTKRPKRKGAG